MANRFTDTRKWTKPLIRSLKAPYKLLWFYICDDCDHAGIWQVDMEIAQIRIGPDAPITEHDAILALGDKIVIFDDGNKWFIPSFIEYQYPGGLKENNKAHQGVIKILEKYKLHEAPAKPLNSPSKGVLDKEYDKEYVLGSKENEEMVVREMDKIWKSRNPGYIADQVVDFHAYLEIAYKIAEMKGWMRPSILDVHEYDVLNSWTKIVDYLVGPSQDKYLKKLTVDGIAKAANFQKVVNSMREVFQPKPRIVV